MPTNAAEQAELAHLTRLSRALDAAVRVPGTNLRLGLDPLLGLVPGLGDWAGALASGYILIRAARLGAARSTLLRMAGNIGVDLLVGTIPVLGDIFDMGWRANERNVALLREHLAAPVRRGRADRLFVLALVVGLGALVIAAMALGLWLLAAAVHAIVG